MSAQGCEETTFAATIEPYRGELHSHCCRMLNCPHDAEDAFQEAMLRAWRGLPSFQGRSSLRTWLYRISTNACLDVIARRRKTRVLPIDYEPGNDPHDAGTIEIADESTPSPEEAYELREGAERASAVAFEHLPANQRTVLVLRTVVGLSARETADALGTSVASVNSSLQRARRAIDGLGDEVAALGRSHSLAEHHVDALQRGDLAGVIGTLTARRPVAPTLGSPRP
jgi:RNA polymerase sigma-70 factor, ECF subfamily